MEKLKLMTSFIGALGAAITTALGGWDTGMITLLIFMGVDYLTGLIVAGVFNASPKSEHGALESYAGFKGLCRKGVALLIVLVATQLDRVIGSNFIRDAVVIAYIANELVSIVENAGLMGVPIPKAIKKGIDILKDKNDENNKEF